MSPISYAARSAASRLLGGGLVPRVDLGERLARRDRSPRLREADDADGVVDRLARAVPPRAELERGDATSLARSSRTNPLAGAAPARRPERPAGRRVGVAALRADPLLVGREGRAVRHRGFGAAPPLRLVDAEIREREQLSGRIEDELAEVRRPAAAHRLPRLPHLERVPDRAAERLIHVRQHADDVHPGLLAERAHLLGELARILDRPHERALADLDVEHERARAGGDLLRHDARRDERDLVDRRRHIAQRVELLVGRNEVRALSRHSDADRARLLDELVGRQLDAEAGNRLELVERPARVAEPAAAHLPERHAARRDDRRRPRS